MGDAPNQLATDEVAIVWKVPDSWPDIPDVIHPTGELMSIHHSIDGAKEAKHNLEDESSMNGYQFKIGIETVSK